MTTNPALPLLPIDLEQTVSRALSEDIGTGDVTASLIPPDQRCSADVVCREHAVLAGVPWFNKVYALIDSALDITWNSNDGGTIQAGSVVCTIAGSARSVVTGERCALNFLQTLSATATVTRRYVESLGNSQTRILDTRKTIPGLRAAQKYAVRCGGGENHRMGLYDAVLIKENHIAAAGSVGAAIDAIRASHPELRIEVEVESMAELEQALSAGTDMVLLDNFDLDAIRRATAFVAGRALVEVSGGIEMDTLAELGQAGADFISVGALTKHIRAIDFSMRIRS